VVIAMEAKTGEILAMAVNPRYDPNWFSAGRIQLGRWRSLVNDPESPLQNRAIQALYAPGSIFKIVTASAALDTSTYRFGGAPASCHGSRCHGTSRVPIR
jgi:cell division protein FtsI/penicillin-binding protein 2